MLPSINQNRQGMNVQAPKVPSAQQYAQGRPQNASGLPPRPAMGMAPDNGQHGGAQRYMTPQSGAMNMANQRNANPYGNAKTAYYGNTQPLPPVQGQLSAMPMPQQQDQSQSNMNYRQALQNRMFNVRTNPIPNQAPAVQPMMNQAPAMPPMFGYRNI